MFIVMFGLMSGRFFFHPFLMAGFGFLMALVNTVVILTTHSRLARGEGDYYGVGLKIIS
jgi:hypothetical protein